MDFDSAFDEIVSAMQQASKKDGHAEASRAIERLGLTEQGDGTPSQITVWEKSAEGKTLRFKWRWYDQSKAFSIQPDMNVLTVELRAGDTVRRQFEHRYEDQY